jgi:hypothetical protein
MNKEFKTHYRYIYFVQIYSLSKKRKTMQWDCRGWHSDQSLGQVKWYGPWRQYCFFPGADTVFNVGCMNDICNFIGQLMADRKKEKEKTL